MRKLTLMGKMVPIGFLIFLSVALIVDLAWELDIPDFFENSQSMWAIVYVVFGIVVFIGGIGLTIYEEKLKSRIFTVVGTIGILVFLVIDWHV